MIYITVDNADRVTEVIDSDRQARPPASIELTPSEARTIATHPIGHAAFDYVGGQLVENSARQSDAELSRNRTAKAAEIRAHALELIGGLVPELANADTMDLIVELYQAGAFRAAFPTTGSDMARVKDIYLYAKTKISQARTATQAQLDAYDPGTDPNWP